MGHRQADNGHIKVGCTMHDVGNKIRNVCYTVSHVSYNTHKVSLPQAKGPREDPNPTQFLGTTLQKKS